MKYLLLIGCLLLVAGAIRADVDVKEVLREQLESCAAEQNIPLEELPKINDFELEGEERKKFGCLNACIMKQTGIHDGTNIDVEKYKEIAEKVNEGDADKVLKAIEDMQACVTEVSVKEIADDCEEAFQFSRCIMLKHGS